MDFDIVPGDISPVNDPFSTGPESVLRPPRFSLPEVGARGSPCVKNLASPGPMAVLSPVTNLALNMNNLAVLGGWVGLGCFFGSENINNRRGISWKWLRLLTFYYSCYQGLVCLCDSETVYIVLKQTWFSLNALFLHFDAVNVKHQSGRKTCPFWRSLPSPLMPPLMQVSLGILH